MIKVSEQHFNRTVQTISDTNREIAAKPKASFVAAYKKHVANLTTLLAELEICNNLTSDEQLMCSAAIYARMVELSKTN